MIPKTGLLPLILAPALALAQDAEPADDVDEPTASEGDSDPGGSTPGGDDAGDAVIDRQMSSDAEIDDGDTVSGDAEADLQEAGNSAGQNMFGGRIDEGSQVIVSLGFPHGIAGDFRFTWGIFQLAPHIHFDYGNPFGANIDLGTGAGIGGRVNVFSQDGWDIAVRFDVAVDLRFHPGTNFRANLNLLDPGVRASYNVLDIVDMDFGLDLLPQLRFGTGGGGSVGFGMAVPFVFGAEGDIVPGVQLGFTTRLGPSFNVGPTVPGTFAGVRPYAEVLLHAGFSLGNVKKALRK